MSPRPPPRVSAWLSAALLSALLLPEARAQPQPSSPPPSSPPGAAALPPPPSAAATTPAPASTAPAPVLPLLPAPQPPQPPPPGPPPGLDVRVAPPEVDRLMRYGVTFGGSAALQLGRVISNSTVSQDTQNLVFMPYLLVAPAYWGGSLGPLCAAHLAATDAAQKTLKDRYGLEGTVARECMWYKLGVYFGRPFNYDSTTSVARAGQTQRVREIRSLASTGITLSPSSYYTLLLGLTFSEVSRDDGTAASLITPTLSLGLNADVLKLLFHPER